MWGYLWRLLLLKRNRSYVLWRHHSRSGCYGRLRCHSLRSGSHGRLRRHSLRSGGHRSLGVSLRCGLRPRCCSGLWGRSSVRLLQQRGFVLFLYRAILLSQLILLFCCGRRRRHRDGTVLGVRERSGRRTCGLRRRRDLVPPPFRGVLLEGVHRLTRRRIRIEVIIQYVLGHALAKVCRHRVLLTYGERVDDFCLPRARIHDHVLLTNIKHLVPWHGMAYLGLRLGDLLWRRLRLCGRDEFVDCVLGLGRTAKRIRLSVAGNLTSRELSASLLDHWAVNRGRLVIGLHDRRAPFRHQDVLSYTLGARAEVANLRAAREVPAGQNLRSMGGQLLGFLNVARPKELA